MYMYMYIYIYVYIIYYLQVKGCSMGTDCTARYTYTFMGRFE